MPLSRPSSRTAPASLSMMRRTSSEPPAMTRSPQGEKATAQIAPNPLDGRTSRSRVPSTASTMQQQPQPQPAAMRRPQGEKARDQMLAVSFTLQTASALTSGSRRRRRRSKPPDARYRPSGEHARALIRALMREPLDCSSCRKSPVSARKRRRSPFSFPTATPCAGPRKAAAWPRTVANCGPVGNRLLSPAITRQRWWHSGEQSQRLKPEWPGSGAASNIPPQEPRVLQGGDQ
mmetsp:Transcript_48399/g.144546  ORF Transcript_48399/g.144546 Transcript_48399/m.144546 type:complete len:233 (+) Transcript_48399:451-1149(+)